jgi:hypothetical protein
MTYIAVFVKVGPLSKTVLKDSPPWLSVLHKKRNLVSRLRGSILTHAAVRGYCT